MRVHSGLLFFSSSFFGSADRTEEDGVRQRRPQEGCRGRRELCVRALTSQFPERHGRGRSSLSTSLSPSSAHVLESVLACRFVSRMLGVGERSPLLPLSTFPLAPSSSKTYNAMLSAGAWRKSDFLNYSSLVERSLEKGCSVARDHRRVVVG